MNNELKRMQKLAGLITEEISDEAYDRMNGLVNQSDYKNFISSAKNIMRDLTNNRFEVKDVFHYLYTRLTAEV